MSSINVLKSSLSSRKGLAHNNRFEVVFSKPGVKSVEEISVLCTSTAIPSKSILSTDFISIKKQEKIPYGYQVEDIKLVFHLTNDYYIKKIFDKWLNEIVNPKNFHIGYVNEFTTDIKIYQLNYENRRIYGVNLKNAYPTSVDAIEFENAATDTQKLSVTITFEDYEIIDLYNFNRLDKAVKFIKNLFD